MLAGPTPGGPFAHLARQPVPPRGDLRRQRHELRPVQRGRRPCGTVPVRRRGERGVRRPGRGGRPRLARLPAERRPGAGVRLPRARPVRPGERPARQPEQAAPRPLRQGDQRRHRLGPGAVLVHVRRPGLDRRPGLGVPHDEGRRHQPVLRLAGRPGSPDPLRRDGDLRGARQGPHRDAPGRPRGAARHLRRRRAPRRDRAPQAARDHDARAHARAPVRQRLHAAGEGAVELLGLQHDRLLRAALALLVVRRPRAAGAGVQGDGPRAPPCWDRGGPRRRLQPHGRGQPPRTDAVLPRHRQRGLLPPGRGRQAVLHGHDRYGQLAQRRAPALAAAHHGLAAVLGDRDARRRVPLRPGRGPGAGVLRGRPARRVLRTGPAGPDRVAGQAHRRTVGRRTRRVPGRQLPAAVVRVERQVP